MYRVQNLKEARWIPGVDCAYIDYKEARWVPGVGFEASRDT